MIPPCHISYFCLHIRVSIIGFQGLFLAMLHRQVFIWSRLSGSFSDLNLIFDYFKHEVYSFSDGKRGWKHRTCVSKPY